MLLSCPVSSLELRVGSCANNPRIVQAVQHLYDEEDFPPFQLHLVRGVIYNSPASSVSLWRYAWVTSSSQSGMQRALARVGSSLTDETHTVEEVWIRTTFPLSLNP